MFFLELHTPNSSKVIIKNFAEYETRKETGIDRVQAEETVKQHLVRSGGAPQMVPEQPGTMGDLMLHETAVARVRLKIGKGTPAQPWLETPEQFKARMQQVCREVNAEYEVESLCRELPSRLEALKDRGGDKLKK